MEGMFLQSVPVLGSLVAGIALLAIVAAAVAYGWGHEKGSHRTTEGQALRKTA